MQNEKKICELLEKANSLPSVPGVYIMRDKNNKIIYVGKSKKLKNRVTQYFQNNQKSIKTMRMVNCVNDFEYIVCKTEIEALSLENSLIKQNSPKYNIKLKDAKSYPYIKITNEAYPKLVFTRTRLADKAKYFGPFSGAGVVYSILDVLHKSVGIPNCKRKFPQDFGKERPCIYYQMNQCCGLCTGKVSKKEYAELISCATDILKGNVNKAKSKLETQMYLYAEAENFERAARCRDAIVALDKIKQKQNVVSSPDSNLDVFGMYSNDFGACISAMYIRNGTVNDKSDYLLNSDAILDSGTITSFLADHYIKNDYIPKEILVSFVLDESDKNTLSEFLSSKASRKIIIRRPERGSMRELCTVLDNNASEKLRQNQLESQKDESVLIDLANILGLESVPTRIEAYDISNFGNENITAGMVVYKDGKPSKADYRTFNIKTLTQADDYSSMREALKRRLEHLKQDTSGSFSEYPDLLLIDGGRGHVSVVKQVLAEEYFNIPVFGMVKDEFHKTRALCTDKYEINIAREKAIFILIYKIQEEVHRFTVSRSGNAKRKTLKHSSLEKIKGIGPAKSKALLAHFSSLNAIKNASVEKLCEVKGISKDNAEEIKKHFIGS